jgi:hypothetical protein
MTISFLLDVLLFVKTTVAATANGVALAATTNGVAVAATTNGVAVAATTNGVAVAAFLPTLCFLFWGVSSLTCAITSSLGRGQSSSQYCRGANGRNFFQSSTCLMG